MKYIKCFEEYSGVSIGPGGELVGMKDIRLTYPYEEIWNLIEDYFKENQENWLVFGWSIFDAIGNENLDTKYNSPSNSFFRVEKLDELDNQTRPVLDYLSTDEEAHEKAKQAGFILDADGIVLGLDGRNLLEEYNK